jgi:DNA-binding transcriptional ArsR family regulator
MNASQYFKSLSDDTRLRILLLTLRHHELCVCELTTALNMIQPKISRHLALLRNTGLLMDERRGQWVYYRINSNLPNWVTEVLNSTNSANETLIADDLLRLQNMGDRPTYPTASSSVTVCC